MIDILVTLYIGDMYIDYLPMIVIDWIQYPPEGLQHVHACKMHVILVDTACIVRVIYTHVKIALRVFMAERSIFAYTRKFWCSIPS